MEGKGGFLPQAWNASLVHRLLEITFGLTRVMARLKAICRGARRGRGSSSLSHL